MAMSGIEGESRVSADLMLTRCYFLSAPRYILVPLYEPYIEGTDHRRMYHYTEPFAYDSLCKVVRFYEWVHSGHWEEHL